MSRPGVGAWLNSYCRSRMCVHLEPCGPLGPVPPNSRLSSLLWQSVQRIWVPMARPCVAPSRFSMLRSRLGCGRELLLGCMTGWLDVAVMANCGIRLSGSPSRDGPHREVSIDGQDLLAGAGAVAAQAVLILIDGRRENADAVAGVDAGDVFLRDADQRRWWKQRPPAASHAGCGSQRRWRDDCC